LLCLKYGKYINEGNQKSDHEIYAIKEGGIFIIQTDKGIYTTDFPLQKIDSFIFENSRFDESVFALHGAAVEYDGRAYLLLASTHGGKTTLTSFLTSRGFGYITDDCVLLDRNDFKIYPNNTPIHLRDGGLEVLKKYNAEPTGLKFWTTSQSVGMCILPGIVL
jgi:serine kinase of HPr protein (carbohydrate metabolism regulator)